MCWDSKTELRWTGDPTVAHLGCGQASRLSWLRNLMLKDLRTYKIACIGKLYAELSYRQ